MSILPQRKFVVTRLDNDIADIVFSHLEVTVTTGVQTNASYSVSLMSNPTSPVLIHFLPLSTTGNYHAYPSVFEFNSANWQDSVTVNVWVTTSHVTQTLLNSHIVHIISSDDVAYARLNIPTVVVKVAHLPIPEPPAPKILRVVMDPSGARLTVYFDSPTNRGIGKVERTTQGFACNSAFGVTGLGEGLVF